MAFIGPWEIALIIIVALIFFGPKKLPELAQSLGKAIREYRKATSSFEELVKEPVQTISKPLTVEKPETSKAKVETEGKAKPPAETTEKKSAEETLVGTAKKLGLETEGKTLEQISEEIVKSYKGAPSSKPKTKIKTKSKPKPKPKPKPDS